MRGACNAATLVLPLLLVAGSACVGDLGDEGCPDGCPGDARCVAGSCVLCETGLDACKRAGTACGVATERCSGTEVDCSKIAGLCDAERPGTICGDGACCAPDCAIAGCGGLTCDGERCSDCQNLRNTQGSTFGDGGDWPAGRPSGRSGAAFAVDPATGRGLLFGGATRTPTEADPLLRKLNDDSWRLEPDGLTWTQVTTASAPAPRINGRLAFDEEHGVFLLFGGWERDPIAGEQLSSELWLFDGTEWTELFPPGESPGWRQRHVFTYDPVREEVVLLGGDDAGGAPLPDQWAFRYDGGGSGSWRRVEPDPAPPARFGATLTVVGTGATRGLLLHAGTTNATIGAEAASDSWLWDGARWTAVTLAGDEPVSRAESCAAPLADGRLLLAGGAGVDPELPAAQLLDPVAGTLSTVTGQFHTRSGCIGGGVGGVPTIGYGVDSGRNPDDLWQLGSE